MCAWCSKRSSSGTSAKFGKDSATKKSEQSRAPSPSATSWKAGGGGGKARAATQAAAKGEDALSPSWQSVDEGREDLRAAAKAFHEPPQQQVQ